MKSKTLGQIGYEAYARHTGGKTFDGRLMPTWEQVVAGGTAVAGAWEAAAQAIADAGPKSTAPVADKDGGDQDCG